MFGVLRASPLRRWLPAAVVIAFAVLLVALRPSDEHNKRHVRSNVCRGKARGSLIQTSPPAIHQEGASRGCASANRQSAAGCQGNEDQRYGSSSSTRLARRLANR